MHTVSGATLGDVLLHWYCLVQINMGHHLIPKQSFIAGLATLNRLSTKDRQLQWGRFIDAIFILCNQSTEFKSHLFFNRNFSKHIWQIAFMKSSISEADADWSTELN